MISKDIELNIPEGLEVVGDTLEQLWISYNKVDKLGPLAKMVKLKTLYMAHNNVKSVFFSQIICFEFRTLCILSYLTLEKVCNAKNSIFFFE